MALITIAGAVIVGAFVFRHLEIDTCLGAVDDGAIIHKCAKELAMVMPTHTARFHTNGIFSSGNWLPYFLVRA